MIDTALAMFTNFVRWLSTN